MSRSKASEQNAIEARCIRQCVLMTATSTSAGAVLLWEVLPQLAVVLLSLPFKSCGWDLSVVPIARVPAESTRTSLRGAQSGVVRHRHAAVLEGEVAAAVLDNEFP